MAEDALRPGWPGRGYDPTAGFSDLQWYMYHQRNVAYFGAFSASDFDAGSALLTARGIVAALPHLAEGYRGAIAGQLPPDDHLRRIVSIEDVPDFAGFPDLWLDRGNAVAADPDLPLFRIGIARLPAGPDAEGRRSFVMVQLCHAFAEGADSAALSRSRDATHHPVAPAGPERPMMALAARAVGGFALAMQLLVGRLWTPHPGDIHVVSRAWPRRELMDLARRLGVSQRALFMALTAVVVAGAGHGARRRISATYSTLDPGGPRNRDPFIRMRMRFATLDDAADFAALARAVDRRLAEVDARPDGLGPELAAVVPGLHRRLAARLPWLYSPKVFAFMPYDFIFALLPPHRLAGPLAAGLLEPVYAAATLPGVVGCVVVPGRRMVSFNFALEQHRMDDVERLDRVLHEQGIGTSVLDATTISPG